MDAEAAIDLINYAYFKRVVQKPKKKPDNKVDAGENEGSGKRGLVVQWIPCFYM